MGTITKVIASVVRIPFNFVGTVINDVKELNENEQLKAEAKTITDDGLDPEEKKLLAAHRRMKTAPQQVRQG